MPPCIQYNLDPWIEGRSTNLYIKQIFQSWLKYGLKNHRFFFRSMSGFPNIITRKDTEFKFKDSVPKNLCSHLFYKFLCSCCHVIYYGQTEKHLFVLSSEYLGLMPLTGKCIKNICN